MDADTCRLTLFGGTEDSLGVANSQHRFIYQTVVGQSILVDTKVGIVYGLTGYGPEIKNLPINLGNLYRN